MIQKKCVVICFIICIPIIFHGLSLQKQLVQIRISYYLNQTNIPSVQLIQDIYQQINDLEKNKDQNLLFSYWGIVASELNLYYPSHNYLTLLTQFYKEHNKNINQSNSPQILQQTGEFALLMLKLDKKNSLKYLMDARTLFMKTLQKDSDNIYAKIGLGKWWAYDVIDENHMEFNHSLAQVRKYLEIDNLLYLQSSKDSWDKITLFNTYHILSILEMKVLNTEKSLNEFNNLLLLFPDSVMSHKLKKNYEQNIIEWF